MKLGWRICEACGKRYRPRKPWQKYCTLTCANRIYSREYIKRLKTQARQALLSGDKGRKGLALETPEYTE